MQKCYLMKMYGDDCMTRFVVQEHTEDHDIVSLLPDPKLRMLFYHLLHDSSHTYFGNLHICMVILCGNAISTSDRNKTKRAFDIIKRHVDERYLGAKSPFGV